MAKTDLVELARSIAQEQGLDPALVCGIVEQESGWNPYAVRYEPGFYRRYLASRYPDGPGTEGTCRAISWGLMQVMGETAREAGFDASSLAALCDPATGLQIGCRVFKGKLEKAKGDVVKALLRWNGGSNKQYAAEVLRRVSRYAENKAA